MLVGLREDIEVGQIVPVKSDSTTPIDGTFVLYVKSQWKNKTF